MSKCWIPQVSKLNYLRLFFFLLFALISGSVSLHAQPFEHTRPSVPAFGQEDDARIISGLLFNASSSELPFWLSANRGGMMPLDSGANTLFYQAYHTSLTQTKSLWDIRAGGSFFAGYNDVNTQFGLTNLYVHLRRYGFRLSIGRYYEEIGFGAPHLSTGKMMVSRNARPGGLAFIRMAIWRYRKPPVF